MVKLESEVTMASKLLNLKKAGEVLGVSDRTVQNLIERGLLPGFQVGNRWRVDPDDLQNFIIRQKEKAAIVEEKQPGVIEMIAEGAALSAALHPDAEEREELEHLFLEWVAANPHIKVRLEEAGLVFSGLQDQITVTVDEEKRLIAEKKRAELAAAGRR